MQLLRQSDPNARPNVGKGAGVFADGLKQAVDSGLGNVRYLN